MNNEHCKITLLSGKNINSRYADDASFLISELSGRRIDITTHDLERMASRNFVFAAFENESSDILIGLSCLVVMDLPQGKRMLAESIVVHPEFRRKGIGRALVQAMLQETKRQSGQHLSLTCNPRREAANRLYRSLGFETAETTLLRASLPAVA